MVDVIAAIQLRILFDNRLVPDLELTPNAGLTTRDVAPRALVALATVVCAPVRHGLFDRAADIAQIVRQVICVQSRLHCHHPAVVDKHASFEREVAIPRYRQAINVLAFLKWNHRNDLMVVAMPPAPVVVNAKPAPNSLTASFTGIKSVRDFFTLLSTALALVVCDQISFATLTVPGNRFLEVLRPLFHIPEDVMSPTLGEVLASFLCLRLCRQGPSTLFFKLGRLPILIPINQVAMVGGVIGVAHKLQVLWAIVRLIKILVVNDCLLAFKARDRAEQTSAGNHPMSALPASGVVLLDPHIAFRVELPVQGHQGRAGR